MADDWYRFRSRPSPAIPDDLREDLYAFARYELEHNDIEKEVLEKAQREAQGDEEKVIQLYIDFRAERLWEEMVRQSRSIRELLTRDYMEWPRTAKVTPIGSRTEWDLMQERVRAHPEYQKMLRDTGNDTLMKGSILVIFIGLIFIVGITLGPVHPGLTIVLALFLVLLLQFVLSSFF